MMLKGLLKNIDFSLEEAARDMGADSFTVFMTVTFPLIKDGLLPELPCDGGLYPGEDYGFQSQKQENLSGG